MCCPQFTLNLEVEFDNDPGKFGGSATNRKCTDIFGLIIVVLYFGIVIGLTVYCILNSDVDKILIGYDDNGNICGKNNINRDSIQFEGFGKNMEEKKYVFIKEDATLGQRKECVENCTKPGKLLRYNYCVADKKNFPIITEVRVFWVYVFFSWTCFLILTLVTVYLIFDCNWTFPFIFVSFGQLISLLSTIVCWSFTLFNFFLSYHFKTVLIAAIILSILTISIYRWPYMQETNTKMFFTAQIVPEIKLTIHSMPLLMLQPFLFSLIFSIVLAMVIHCWLFLQTFSYPQQITVGTSNETIIDYFPYPIATVTGALLIYGFILFYEILKNCLCFIVGGCVAQWYFTRRNNGLSQPIRRTVANLLKYHLGSVCCASLLLPFIYVVRAVINGIKGAASGNNKESIYTCSCRLLSETCLATYVTCLNFFSRNGLILTAIYGCTFCDGATREHKLINHNIFNVASVKNYVDFLIVFIEILMVGLQWVGFVWLVFTVVPVIVKTQWITLICYLIVCCIHVDFFISVLDVILETHFLCFCEDVQYKSGAPKPYYMSTNFAQFVENMNKNMDPLKWQKIADNWDKGPKRVYSHENNFEINCSNEVQSFMNR